jgi:hypothetical protein
MINPIKYSVNLEFSPTRLVKEVAKFVRAEFALVKKHIFAPVAETLGAKLPGKVVAGLTAIVPSVLALVAAIVYTVLVGPALTLVQSEEEMEKVMDAQLTPKDLDAIEDEYAQLEMENGIEEMDENERAKLAQLQAEAKRMDEFLGIESDSDSE